MHGKVNEVRVQLLCPVPLGLSSLESGTTEMCSLFALSLHFLGCQQMDCA